VLLLARRARSGWSRLPWDRSGVYLLCKSLSPLLSSEVSFLDSSQLTINSIDIFWDMVSNSTNEHGTKKSSNPPQHAIFCVISFGDKVIKLTDSSTANAFAPSDPIRISVNLRSPLESHVTIEVKVSPHSLLLMVRSSKISSDLSPERSSPEDPESL
jgi:hypothetical protein